MASSKILVLLYISVAFLIISEKEISLVFEGDFGTATSYNPSSSTPTKCGGEFPPGNLFVAVSEELWDKGAACGRRYRLKCVSGVNRPCKDITTTVDVVVLDFCSQRPSCPTTFLMSNDAFSVISRSQNAKIIIDYMEM